MHQYDVHPALGITLFGSPEVCLHGWSVSGFRSSKAQALLYYLAVTARPHTRSVLTGLLWGDQPEAAARVSLSKCLSNLHDLLGDAVLIDRQTATFNRDHPYQLDVERFEAGVKISPTIASIASLQAALALYRGDFLEGFYVRDAPDFEQWLLIRRAHYREAVINGLHALANFYEQHGDLPQAITHTRRLLTLEPWREEAHRQLMSQLARSGQRAAALKQFDVCQRVLDEELAVKPDAETLALVEAIHTGKFDQENERQNHPATLTSARSAEPSPLPLITTPLPIPPTPLIGRGRELAELGELISNPQCRLVTITGTGGMGKTRLALAVAAAAEQSGKFQHGAVFVPLAGVSSVQFLPQAILSALNVPLQGVLSPQQQVRLTLHNQECLLVLDNYEHLLPDVDLVLDMLHYAPKVTLLVTSRERLALQAEYLHELAGLAYPHDQPIQLATKPLSDLSGYAALQLFLYRVRQTQPHFEPSDRELAAIVRICRISEGMPLALELTAAALRMQPCEEIASELVNGQRLIIPIMRDRPLRHQSIYASFEHSWRLLTGQEQQLLRQLAVFRGGFYSIAAQRIARATLPLLATLVDKSLIQLGANPVDAEWYTVHELIRQYTLEKLQAAGELELTQQRHCAYYLTLVKEAEAKLHTKQHRQMLDCLEINHDNLRAALEWAVTNDGETALDLVASLGSFWRHRGYISEGRGWLQQALHKSEQLSPARAKALLRLGDLIGIQGERELALAQQEASLILARQLGDQLGIALALRSIGWFYVQLDKPRAIQYFEQCLALLRTVEDERRSAQLLGNLAQLVFEQYGDVARTRQYLQESRSLAQKNDDTRSIIQALNVEAQLASSQGEYAQEMRLLQEMLPLARLLGIKQDEGWVLSALAETARYVGDLVLARQSGEASRTIFMELGFQSGLAVAVHHLGMVALSSQDLHTAKRLLAESLQLSQATARKPLIARCLAGLGGVAAEQFEGQRAARLLSAADSLFTALPPFLTPADHAEYKQFAQCTRTQLAEVAYLANWNEGKAMSVEQAVAYALAEAQPA